MVAMRAPVRARRLSGAACSTLTSRAREGSAGENSGCMAVSTATCLKFGPVLQCTALPSWFQPGKAPPVSLTRTTGKAGSAASSTSGLPLGVNSARCRWWAFSKAIWRPVGESMMRVAKSASASARTSCPSRCIEISRVLAVELPRPVAVSARSWA